MNDPEHWTTAHDLALIYSGLACLDRDLTDEEVRAIEQALAGWEDLPMDTPVTDIVQAAATALKQSQMSIQRAVQRVGDELEPTTQRDALQSLLQIAKADGVLLECERELIHHIADAWALKRLGDAEGDALEGETLLHGLAVLFVHVGHVSNSRPSEDTVEVLLRRLREWQPETPDEEAQVVLRRALQAYAKEAEADRIDATGARIAEALPPVQQLFVLEDLHTLVQVDGPPTEDEQRAIRSLAEAWDINVRLGSS